MSDNTMATLGDLTPESQVLVGHQDVTGFVEKAAGKGLSSNDYTDAEKAKLDGIEAGAQANVRADWEESDSDSMSFVRNKPDLSSLGVQADWEESDSDSLAFVRNKPSIPTPQVQADWEESDSDSMSFVRNKPDLSSLGVQADWEESDSDSLAFIKGKPTLFSGSYDDLTDKPTLFSGSYDDLTDKPTIPAAQVRANWNETDAGSMAFIQNKPAIPEVRYALVSPQPSNGVVTLQDRAVNSVSLASQVSYQAWRPSTGDDLIGIDSGDTLSALSVSWDPVAGRWTVQDAQGLYDSVSTAPYSQVASSTHITGDWYLEAMNPTLTVNSFDPEDPYSASFAIAADIRGGKHLTLTLSGGYAESDGDDGYWVEAEIVSTQADTPYNSVDWGADTNGFISLHLVPDGNGSYVQAVGNTLGVYVSGTYDFVRDPYYVFTWSDEGTGHGGIVSDGHGGYHLSSDSDFASWDGQSVYEVNANEWEVSVYRNITISPTVTAVDGNGVPTEVGYDGTSYDVTVPDGDCTLYITMGGAQLSNDEFCYGEGGSRPGLGDTIDFFGDDSRDYVVTRSPVMASALPLLALPPQVSGKARDFILRLDMPADLELAVRFGDMETRDGDFPELKAGVNYLSFTETGANRFLVTALQAEAV